MSDKFWNEEFWKEDDLELAKVTQSASHQTMLLIDYIEREFRTDRARATFAAGVLIGSLEEMIKLSNGQDAVKEIIGEYDELLQN